jgi:DNA-binding PadR family transcriptional regulator
MPMMREHGRSYLQSCLLLLIAERPAHGYDLITRLESLGFLDADPACTYRALRALERDGLGSSAWRPSKPGPARREYRLTGPGRIQLAESGDEVQRAFEELHSFLERLTALRPAAADGAPVAINSGARR